MTWTEVRQIRAVTYLMVFTYVFIAAYNIYKATKTQSETIKPADDSNEMVQEGYMLYSSVMSWKYITVVLVVMYLFMASMNIYKTVKR